MSERESVGGKRGGRYIWYWSEHPILQVHQPAIATKHSLELMGMDDPLGGNQNFEVLRPLVPGATSSVYLCRDLRDNVSTVFSLLFTGT